MSDAPPSPPDDSASRDDFAAALCQARERRNLTVEDVHETTGISVLVIRALEAGELNRFEPVFLRLGLRTYAAFLDLEVEALVAAYDRTRPAPVQRAGPTPTELPDSGSIPRLTGIPRKWQLAGAGGIALFLALILVAVFGDGNGDAPAKPKPRSLPSVPAAAALAPTAAPDHDDDAGAGADSTISATAAPGAAPAIDEPGAVRKPAPPPTPPAGGGAEPDLSATESAATNPASPTLTAAVDSSLTFRIEAIDEVWVRIQADGGIAFEQTVPPGFVSPTWQAREYFHVTSGKPHGLRYWFRGEPVSQERLGDPNSVLRFTATHRGIELLKLNRRLPSPANATSSDSAR